MKNNIKPGRWFYYLLPLFCYAACRKPCQDPQPVPPPAAQFLIREVNFPSTVTHFLRFSYNNDSLLTEMNSGSDNLPGTFREHFTWENGLLAKAESPGSKTLFTYDASARITKESRWSGDKETTRYNYAYNNTGELIFMRCQNISGSLPVTLWECEYEYENGLLRESMLDVYGESGIEYTITRKFEAHSPELSIQPRALLHPLYQHRAREVFNLAFLANTNKLPVSFTETGDPDVGTLRQQYSYFHTGTRIDSLTSIMQVGSETPYQTALATFHY